MKSVHIHKERPDSGQPGYCHLAFSLENEEVVIELTERLRSDGYQITREPRTTGDGYFESVISDPDGNLIELVAQ